VRSLSLQYAGLKGSLHGGFSVIDNKFGRAILKIDEPEVNEKFGGVNGHSRIYDWIARSQVFASKINQGLSH